MYSLTYSVLSCIYVYVHAHQLMFSLLHRNGLLIEHNLVEVNGQNVVGLKVSNIIHVLMLKETNYFPEGLDSSR